MVAAVQEKDASQKSKNENAAPGNGVQPAQPEEDQADVERPKPNGVDAVARESEDIEGEMKLPEVLFGEISDRAEFLAGRMEKRTNTYMILGVAMGLIGLGFWYWSFRDVVGRHYDTFTAFAQATLPRITILLFIELFAGFFLRQYRIGVEDFKYFFEIEHKADWKRIGYAILSTIGDTKGLQKLASGLGENDLSTRLKKGESTPALETLKSETNITLEAVKALGDTAKGLATLIKDKKK